MTTRQFIFSNERRYRLTRHAAFWCMYGVVYFFTAQNVDSLKDLTDRKFYFYDLTMLVIFLPSSVFMVYMLVYVLIPKLFLTGKYFVFIAAFIGLVLLCFAMNTIPGYTFNFFYPNPPLPPQQMHFIWRILNYTQSVHRGIPLAIGVTCITLARELYLQQIENNRLIKLEAENRIRLVKSQMQPRFFFHSLKSLHEKITNNPDEAPAMVIHLADIFSYLLYDCSGEYVLLEKELAAITNFAIAESMNQKISSRIKVSIVGDSCEKYITPLTLFSFLENHLGGEAGRKFINVSIQIEPSVLAVGIQMEGQLPGHAENSTNSRLKKWSDHLPVNFSNYNIESNELRNTCTISATVTLTPSARIGNLHHYPIAEIE